MSREQSQLEDLQRWMQTVITHPEGIEAGIVSDAARSLVGIDLPGVESVITRSRDHTSVERLAIYGNAYFARLMECMRELFPALVYTLEEDVFDSFTVAYLERYPPESYTLNRLADRFVTFLAESRHELTDREERAVEAGVDAADEDGLDWSDFLLDLGRFEWTIDQVFDGPGVEQETILTADRLREIPPEYWPWARLVPVCCLRLLALRWPVNDYYTAFRSGKKPDLPAPAETYCALTRRDYVVRRLSLSRAQFELLTALVEGKTVGQAVTAAAEATGDLDALSKSLQNWFRQWSAEGLFQRVELPE